MFHPFPKKRFSNFFVCLYSALRNPKVRFVTQKRINPPIKPLEIINRKIDTFVAIERWPKLLILRLINRLQ